MNISLSASSQDRRIAAAIAARLEAEGHRIHVDGQPVKPAEGAGGEGAADPPGGTDGRAEVLLVLISAHALRSHRLVQQFSALALREVSGSRHRIVLLRADDSPVPSHLSQFTQIDLANGLDAGIDTLLRTLDAPEREAGARHRNAQRDEVLAAHLGKLRAALRAGRLSLVCGAGVSVDAGIPEWNLLLLNLLESMIELLSRDHALNLDREAAEYLNRRHGASSLILGRYLKNNLGKDYARKVRDTLYSNEPSGCGLIDAIVDIARPERDGKPLDSIITFNFDALLEENLSRANIRNRAIYSEAVRHDPNELPVYHVHGYLPRSGRIPEGVEIVFSEDAYHNQFIDPFSWSNLMQLNKLTQNTCLFVGVSLTDPNLRRLLDVAWRKNPDKTIGHYAIKKLPRSQGAGSAFDDLARLLEEQDANTLGVNVIWVEDYPEIPGIIRAIR
ncbi:SIR2 family protein [Noviherbaspirillum aridicola]|uniref:TIR domain-containing protein n=1 Tax=Noviherbaspirillum aridicola TaxID=2849687 RepID=A0ABQ4Q465_9BURK|nr:SIR2 family protein [Noviherbaspirillum aridicola]GIZ51883.1 hypothetical protein NCCP691_18970 [Noviherbaspirillum aridicola]